MDSDLERYRSTLKKIYFGDYNSVISRSLQDRYNEFWNFFNKYLLVLKRKNVNSAVEFSKELSATSKIRSIKVYNKYCKQYSSIDLDKTQSYMLRELPKHVIEEFEFILHCYYEFCQRQKLQKLKKLRAAQRSLPIYKFRNEIIKTVRRQSVVILAGDTGCGKSTQLPQYLLHAGFEKICCTQPRRIACISLANRVAHETLHEFGSQIAYQIRFERTRTIATKMLFLTEGLLLRQLGSDSQLSMYDVVILDEIHERHLHGDFLIGILKQLVANRNDLKLILMSATINLELFASYFKNAPVIQVPGRLYPIVLEYHPTESNKEIKESKSEKIDCTPYLKILQLIDHRHPTSERGDVLIFLSGITEITTVAEALKVYADQTARWIILLLHSTLSLEEQDKVFDIAPDGVRKCILSTNIAETSVTIDGVRFVVDSGKMKEMTYVAEMKMHCLKEIWVSQASAEQRKGRAGRTGPGYCFRLYSNTEYDKLDKYSCSEIHRVSLESLILQMFNLGLTEPRTFEFIEPPSKQRMEEAIEYLIDQGAITQIINKEIVEKCEFLSPLGQMLVKLPVDIFIGKMLIMGCLFRQQESVLTIAAALSVQSPFTSKSFRNLDDLLLRKPLLSENGDPFTLLNVYREWLEIKASSHDSTRHWCKKRGIEEQRLYEVTKLRNQFKELLEDSDFIDKCETELSSSERRIRHGQLKRLKDLKRKAQNTQKKRKVLRVGDFEAVYEDDLEKGVEGDVHAVDFQMRYTNSKLQSELAELNFNDYASVTLIKLIMCSALYPLYAILDEYNNYKPGSDQMAHIRNKPFVILHPNSCFGQEPECLIVNKDKDGFSALHQLIFYAMLLETTKPYVVNSIRVPALHSLMLIARQIDTNRDCSRVVFDQWLEIKVIDTSLLQQLIFRAVEIRDEFSKCIERKIDGDHYRSDSLALKIVDFFATEIVFAIRRLMKADQKSLYFGGDNRSRQSVTVDSLPIPIMSKYSKSITANTVKGGVALTEFLTLGCLREEGVINTETEHYLTTHWLCPKCGESFHFTPVERLEHLDITCSSQSIEMKVDDAAGSACSKSLEPFDSNVVGSSKVDDVLKRNYFCGVCDANLLLSPTDILKHKRSHAR